MSELLPLMSLTLPETDMADSKSPRIRTYFFESQAEIGSYFNGTNTNFKVYRFLFEGYIILSP